MNKRKKSIILAIVIAVVIGGWFVQKEYEELRQERYDEKREIFSSIINQRILVRTLDQRVADIIAASIGERRKHAADEAILFASYLRNQYLTSTDVWIELNPQSELFYEISRYLQYVSDTADKEMTDLQHSNLDALRKHLAVMLAFYDNLEKELNPTKQYEVVDKEKLKQVIQSLSVRTRPLPALRFDDEEFKKYMDYKRQYL